MLNEGSSGAAQQGEGRDLPHQTLTPVSSQLPSHWLCFPHELKKSTKRAQFLGFKMILLL